jgi:hypothetical protein
MTRPPSVAGVVCRRPLGLRAIGVPLIVVTALYLAIAESGRFGVIAGMGVMLAAGELQLLREKVTFAPTLVQRSVPGKGRVTWWLDGKAALLYFDDIREPGRWGLPLQHEGLLLVYPGNQFAGRGHERLSQDEIPVECDVLPLVRGILTNERAWASALLEAIEAGRLTAAPAGITYLASLADDGS